MKLSLKKVLEYYQVGSNYLKDPDNENPKSDLDFLKKTKEKEYDISLEELFENVAQDAKKGRMISLMIPKKAGRLLHAPFRDVEGDDVEDDYMHVTLGLVRDKDKDDQIFKILKSKIAPKLNPINMIVRKFDMFPGHEENEYKNVLHAKPESEDFDNIHSTTLNTLKKYGVDIDNGSHDFNPHITIKYTKEKPDLNKKIKPLKIKLNKLHFVIGDKRFPIKLGTGE